MASKTPIPPPSKSKQPKVAKPKASSSRKQQATKDPSTGTMRINSSATASDSQQQQQQQQEITTDSNLATTEQALRRSEEQHQIDSNNRIQQAQTMPTPRVAFVSGPMDATQEYFNTHYAPRIDVAISAGDSFVMGPVDGVDKLALHYLLQHGVPTSRITLYMANFEYSNMAVRKRFEELGVHTKVSKVVGNGRGRMAAQKRDARMTEESDYDILRYRTEEEAKALYGEKWRPRVSNTELNERRRRETPAWRIDLMAERVRGSRTGCGKVNLGDFSAGEERE